MTPSVLSNLYLSAGHPAKSLQGPLVSHPNSVLTLDVTGTLWLPCFYYLFVLKPLKCKQLARLCLHDDSLLSFSLSSPSSLYLSRSLSLSLFHKYIYIKLYIIAKHSNKFPQCMASCSAGVGPYRVSYV